MQPKDQQDRLTAAIPSAHNIIVEAGAGTGKTTLLTDRLCYLILGKDIPIDKIIALTFTEKAAAEIKIRLLAKMQRIISDLDKTENREAAADILLNTFGKTKEDLQKAVQSSFELAERAQISTIHSFCLQILRKYPLEAGLAPQCQADDGVFVQSIFDKKWDAFLEGQLTFDSPSQEVWKELLLHFTLDELKDFAFTLLTPALNNYHPFANLEEIQQYCLECADEAEKLYNLYAPTDPAKKRDIELSLEQAVLRLRQNASLLGTHIKEPAPEDIKEPSSCPKNWPKEDFVKAKDLVAFANDITPQKQLLIMKAFNILSGLKQEVREEIRKENIISYDELIYKTKELLKNVPAVREELKKEYQSILIDEFQDTDPAQGEILLFLAEAKGGCAPSWDKVILEQGKLFVVGDPKQSIYRFRGADITAYEKFTDQMALQGAKKCFLKTNFRSLPNIINFANAFGDKAIEEQKGIQPKYIPIEAGRTESGPKILITAVQSAQEKTPIDLYRQNQAQQIAAWVKDNAYKTKLANGKVMTFKDIAILLRTGTSLDIYTDALKRFDIKFTVEETKNFYTAQEVLDLINILKLLNDPKDKTALLGVLRSPFALLTDGEILTLSKNNQFNIFAAPTNPRAAQIYKMLKELYYKAGRLCVEDLINEIIYNTDFLMLQTLAAQKEQTIANIFKFISVVRKMHAQGALNLGQFLFYAQKYSKDQNKEGESPLAEESLDTLSIMTMHKAKGLEFPVVILTDISGKTVERTDRKPLYITNWYNGACGIRLGSLPDGNFALLEQANKAHAKAEELRILYVALTRAKEHLLLTGDLKDEPSSLAGALQSAGCYPSAELKPQELEGRQDITTLSYVPCHAAEVLTAAQSLAAAADENVLDLKDWREAWKKREQLYKEIIKEKAVLTPSNLDDTEQQEQLFYPQDGAAKITGKLCHKMLYDMFTGHTTNAQKTALSIGEDPSKIAAQIKEAQEIISNFKKSAAFKELQTMEILAAELPFTLRGKDGTIINGIMDAVFKTKDGGVFIADYKSDNIKEEDLTERTALYKQQLLFYKDAAKEIFKQDKAQAAVIYLRPAVSEKV